MTGDMGSLFQIPPVDTSTYVVEAGVSIGSIWESGTTGKKVKRKVWNYICAFVDLNAVGAPVQTVLSNQVYAFSSMQVQHRICEDRSRATWFFDKTGVDLRGGEYRGNHDQPHKYLLSKILLNFAGFGENIKNIGGARFGFLSFSSLIGGAVPQISPPTFS